MIEPPKSRFWQIHLSTAIVLMLVVSGMLLMNLPLKGGFGFHPDGQPDGWLIEFSLTESQSYPSPLPACDKDMFVPVTEHGDVQVKVPWRSFQQGSILESQVGEGGGTYICHGWPAVTWFSTGMMMRMKRPASWYAKDLADGMKHPDLRTWGAWMPWGIAINIGFAALTTALISFVVNWLLRRRVKP